jgi:hypothetical protein
MVGSTAPEHDQASANPFHDATRPAYRVQRRRGLGQELAEDHEHRGRHGRRNHEARARPEALQAVGGRQRGGEHVDQVVPDQDAGEQAARVAHQRKNLAGPLVPLSGEALQLQTVRAHQRGLRSGEKRTDDQAGEEGG